MTATNPEPVRYPNGASVRIRVGTPAHHFPTPAYIQGRGGAVRRLSEPGALVHENEGILDSLIFCRHSDTPNPSS